MFFFFYIFYVKIFCDIVCVLCADVMCPHSLYVCARAVHITAERGYVVIKVFMFLFLFIDCFIFSANNCECAAKVSGSA